MIFCEIKCDDAGIIIHYLLFIILTWCCGVLKTLFTSQVGTYTTFLSYFQLLSVAFGIVNMLYCDRPNFICVNELAWRPGPVRIWSCARTHMGNTGLLANVGSALNW